MYNEYNILLVAVPDGTDLGVLNPEVEKTLRSTLDAKWMSDTPPGTRSYNGEHIVTAILPRVLLQRLAGSKKTLGRLRHDPAVMKQSMEAAAKALGAQWRLLYMRTVDPLPTGKLDKEGNEILEPREWVPMDASAGNFIADVPDENGAMVQPSRPWQVPTFALPNLYRFPVVIQ